MLDEIKPLLQQSKRDPSAINEIWKSLYSQLLAEDNSDSSSLTSLYGTPSIQKGRKLKEFYKVSSNIHVHIHVYISMYSMYVHL